MLKFVHRYEYISKNVKTLFEKGQAKTKKKMVVVRWPRCQTGLEFRSCAKVLRRRNIQNGRKLRRALPFMCGLWSSENADIQFGRKTEEFDRQNTDLPAIQGKKF